MTDERAALAALAALRDEYPGIYMWEDPRWGGPLGSAIARALALPPDPERLADAHQAADNALPTDRTPTHEEWAAAIIAAWEAEK